MSYQFEPFVTLYEMVLVNPCRETWNTNAWKARYALNFKGVPCKTVYVEYPDIEPTMRSIGAPPTGVKSDGSPFYTLPVIVDHSRQGPSGGPTVISESWHIAEYLDNNYHSQYPLLPEGTKALQKLFYDNFVNVIMLPIMPVLLPEVYTRISEGSQPYYRKTREPRLGGRRLEDVAVKGSPEWDQTWGNLQKGLTSLADLLDQNEMGAHAPILGKNITFSDFVISSFLETVYTILNDEWNSKVSKWDGGRWERLRDLCAQWRRAPYDEVQDSPTDSVGPFSE